MRARSCANRTLGLQQPCQDFRLTRHRDAAHLAGAPEMQDSRSGGFTSLLLTTPANPGEGVPQKDLCVWSQQRRLVNKPITMGEVRLSRSNWVGAGDQRLYTKVKSEK